MEPKTKEFYMNDPVFQRLQYEIRNAYESGWRDCCKSHGIKFEESPHTQEPTGWRLAWKSSPIQKFLVANGIIDARVKWK